MYTYTHMSYIHPPPISVSETPWFCSLYYVLTKNL